MLSLSLKVSTNMSKSQTRDRKELLKLSHDYHISNTKMCVTVDTTTIFLPIESVAFVRTQ